VLKFTGLLDVLLEGALLLLGTTAPEVPPPTEAEAWWLWDALKSASTAAAYLTMALGSA
jgi:hypothetical protein